MSNTSCSASSVSSASWASLADSSSGGACGMEGKLASSESASVQEPVCSKAPGPARLRMRSSTAPRMHVVGAMAFQVAAGKAQGGFRGGDLPTIGCLQGGGAQLWSNFMARQRATVSSLPYARKAEVAV